MVKTAYELADWQGYLTHREIDALKRVVKQLPKSPIIVKIGAGAGTDTLAILEERKDALIFSVDINTTNDEISTNEHLRLVETGYDKTGNVIRIWGDSKVVCKMWPLEWGVDMLIVDGDHLEPGITGDIDGWLPKVWSDGFVAFHDYGSHVWPNVKLVVDEKMKDYIVVEHVDTMRIFRV